MSAASPSRPAASRQAASRPAAPGPAASRLSARERLLKTADELFYAEGVHTVGIDRILDQAGVAKASLYSHFGNKDGLIRAYLQGRHEARRTRLTSAVAQHDNPRDQLLAIFDALAEMATSAQFRGCAFYNASAESPTGEGEVAEVCEMNRSWTRTLFTDLAAKAGAPDPSALAAQLVVLYDGSTVGARMDRSTTAVVTARTVAATLIDAAIPLKP